MPEPSLTESGFIGNDEDSKTLNDVLILRLRNLRERIESTNKALGHLGEVVRNPTNSASSSDKLLDLAELSNAALELDYALVIHGFAELCIENSSFDMMVYRIERAIQRAMYTINEFHKNYMKA